MGSVCITQGKPGQIAVEYSIPRESAARERVQHPCARISKEGAILDRQLFGLPVKGKRWSSVLTFATPMDMTILAISSLFSMLAGGLNPLMVIIFGQFLNIFQDFSQHKTTGAELSDQVACWSRYYVYLAIAEFTLIYMTTAGFYVVGERISRRLRMAYLRAVIRQNMAFFDQIEAGEVTSSLTTDVNRIQESITSKLSLSLTAAATFGASLAIAFSIHWQLASILTVGMLFVGFAETLGGRLSIRHSTEALRYYHKSTAVVEEAISSMRNVAALGLQQAMEHRQAAHINLAQAAGLRARLSVALMISVLNAAPYFIYGLATWCGVHFISDSSLAATGVIQITMAIVAGAFALGRVAPAMESFISGIASARTLFQTIARRPPFDPFSKKGTTLVEAKGTITLRDVSLVYPSRPGVTVLEKLSCNFPALQTTALVGGSGSGKSSVVGLIARLYEPTEGNVYLDGHDIKSLNLRWLRDQIAVVGQEPVLFNTTIFANIRCGLPTDNLSDRELNDRVIKAAIKAHAHGFISALPHGYQTIVGAKGLQLSGGQRQRISLARALISEAKILILDEASSALDAVSEQAVQAELDSTPRLRTTLVISHRLSAIRNADNIIVLAHGSVVEQGKHEELMSLKGVYARLVENQKLSEAVKEHVCLSDLEYGLSGTCKDLDSRQEENDPEEAFLSSDSGLDESERTMELRRLLPKAKKTQREKETAPPQRPSFRDYFRTVYRLNFPERFLLIIGAVMCAMTGFLWPLNSVIFGNAVQALSTAQPTDLPVVRAGMPVGFWVIMYAVLGIVAWILWLGQGICFAISSEKLIARARTQIFRAILHQDIEFFDEKPHAAGALAALISSGTDDLAAFSGPVIGSILTFLVTIVIGVIFSSISGWKLALVCSCAIPIIAACGWLRLRILVALDNKMRKANEDAASYASEMISAVQTVAILGLEPKVVNEYQQVLQRLAAKSVRPILLVSGLYAFAHSFTFLAAALTFWYGGKLIVEEGYTVSQVLICFTALISGAQIAGAVFSYAPDMSKAIHASQNLQRIFDRRPHIDTRRSSGKVPAMFTGRIEFEVVSFYYPTRPSHLVLDRLSLTILPGQYIALVGASGCGKSTIIALLERFFDPSCGRILVDGEDISNIDLNEYRKWMSLVSQEPVLYQGTIRENLIFGSTRDITEQDIIQACKEANIYDFISSLPNGFATEVGSSGTMLSGGQKQRIAIARALLRNAKILLLDEATSALDSESERLVQEALDRATKNRITIAIAHRLSTIRQADRICVLDKGQLIESGTHDELMAQGGMYWTLVKLQNQELSIMSGCRLR